MTDKRWDHVVALCVGLAVGTIIYQSVKKVYDVPAVEQPRSLSVERDSIVAQEARRAGVSVSLSISVSHVENTSGDSMAVSKAGAVGIMQVTPRLWQHAFEEECGCGSLFNR